MSVWRKKAIECLPENKKEFEQPDTTIYTIFFELLPALEEAHIAKDKYRLQKIYQFAEWCFRQKEENLWNAAGVTFYEHLVDKPFTLAAFPNWVKKDIYKDVRGLLQLRVSADVIKKIDDHYGVK